MTTDDNRTVDSWRFAGSFLKRVLGGGLPAEDAPTHEPIPWADVRKPLAESRVALLTTAGLSMKGDPPFDMDYERAHPTCGDSSWRKLTSSATASDIDANHLHIDTSFVLNDINVALPLDRLREAAADGRIGSVAPSHYSIMGYQGNSSADLVAKSAPEIVASLRSEAVDLVLLAPV